MRKPILVTSLVTAAILMAGCGGSDEGGGGGDTVVRIAGNSNAAALPVWVGIEHGFFKDCGVDAKYTLIENISTLPSALGKSFDVALSVPPLLVTAADQGIGIKEVAGATLNTRENPQTFMVVPEGSDIKSAKDLEGKTLGVQTITGSTHLGTKMWLKEAGVPYDSINVVQVDGPAQADQLEAGRLDAVETLAPFSTSVLKLGHSIFDPQSSIAPEVSGIFWTASPTWIDKNADGLDCFREGLDKAREFIEGNDEEAKAVLEKQTGLPAEVVEETVLPTYTSDVRPDDLEKWENAMKEVGGFTGDVDVASLVVEN
ncbi:ABC transporter substrate-binding protein [Nocardioides sp. LHG3406-4]|uniref:ABC transporter substrate-binding protein n=1 Tax=Nocardioides sp. LHG3406-4 TaxID=2804575 RepID=UPI003CE8F2C9